MMTVEDLQAAIQSGEGYTLEFKQNVNADLAKEIVAFANSSGGRILVGVEDNGKISGVALNNAIRSQIQNTASNCDPSIPIEIESIANVVVIHVNEGANKPYRCTNGFYVRNGPNSEKLTTEEIAAFFQEHGRIKFDEMPCHALKYPEELGDNAIKNYMAQLNLTSPIDSEQLLLNLGVISHATPHVVNNAGALVFAQKPADLIPQSVVTCVAYKGNSKVDIIDQKNFDFHLVANIDDALAFLKRHLNTAFNISSKQRQERLEIPEVVLREAVVNAVVHRDYSEKGATVMIEVFSNRVEISNPGGLPKGLSINDFGKRTLARNPLLASLLNRIRYIEKLGTGVQRMRSLMDGAGLPEPEFNFNSFFTVTLRRFSVSTLLVEELNVSSKRAERIYYILRQLSAGKLNVEAAAKALDTSARTVRTDLELLIEKSWLSASGTTKDREYRLTALGITKMETYG